MFLHLGADVVPINKIIGILIENTNYQNYQAVFANCFEEDLLSRTEDMPKSFYLLIQQYIQSCVVSISTEPN